MNLKNTSRRIVIKLREKLVHYALFYIKNQGRSSGFFLRYSGLCNRKEVPRIQDLLYTFSEVAIELCL